MYVGTIHGSSTVKRYSSEKRAAEEGEWRHARIVLSPMNKEFSPILIPPDAAEEFRIVAEFVSVYRAEA
jgi:SOS-response transcriptional repressor LexA